MSAKRFDPVIYPQKLWVSISKDGTELNGMFRHKATDEIIRFEEYDVKNYEALTFPVSEVETDYHGVLIVYTRQKYMTCKTIAHEAVHAAGYMFQHIGQEIDSNEPFAFLTGWIADCCWKVKTNKKTFKQ
jgi:hypothetical protein